MMKRLAFACCILFPLLSSPAWAEKVHPPLIELPREKLAELAPLLRTGDFALLESDDKGHERQITTITLSKAPPEVVREVVIHPEKYEDFVRNFQGRSVKHNPDGTFDHAWKVTYAVASFWGVNRYKLLPPREGEPAGAVEMIDPTGMSTYRWEFLPSTHGGGTIVVLYGYTDVRHSGGFVDKILARADTLEHGLALITQLTLHRAMSLEAEKKRGSYAPYTPPAVGSPATSYRFLLDRGALAILRHQDGRLADFSLIDRSVAAAPSLADEFAHPERWKYVPSIVRLQQHDPKDGLDVVDIEQALPLMSWTTRWGARQSQGGVDLFGLEGDQHNDRERYDFRDDHAGDKPVQQVILRGQLSFGRSSLVMRELYKVEPLFEDGVNVGMTFVVLRAVKNAVEQRLAH